MMTWDEYKRVGSLGVWNPAPNIETNIKCPLCGKPVFMKTDVVLTSNPPQYVYFCSCGWQDYTYFKWVY